MAMNRYTWVMIAFTAAMLLMLAGCGTSGG